MSTRTCAVGMKGLLVGAIWLAGGLLLGPAPAWALNLDRNDMRLLYGENAGDDPVKYRDLDVSSGNNALTSAVQITNVGPTSDTTSAEIEWVVEKISPRTGTHLLGIQYVSPGGSCGYTNCVHLNFLTRPDSDNDTASGTWTQVPGFPKTLKDNGAGGNRRFDITVDSARGRFVAAYQDPANDQRLAYLVLRPDGAVASGSTVIASSAGAGAVNWVQLVPNPTTDEVTLLYVIGNNLNSFRWNGSAWTSSPLTINPSVSNPSQAFAGAYEQLSGQLVVVYRINGCGSFSGQACTGYRTMAPGQLSNWSAEVQLASVPAKAVAAAAQLGTDRLAFGVYGNQITQVNVQFVIYALGWDGNQFSQKMVYAPPTGLNSNVDSSGRVPIAVGWTNDTALLTYTDGINSNSSIRYAKWTPGGGAWTFAHQSGFSGFDKYGWMIEPFTGGAKVVVAFSDKNRQLSTAVFDGTSWSATSPTVSTTNLSVHGSSLQSAFGRPFTLAVNGFTIPTLAVAGSPARVPVTPGTAQDLGLTLTITDKSGVIYAESPSDGDAIATQDIAITIPAALTGVVWDQGAVCVGGTANTKIQNGGQGACAAGLRQATATYSGTAKTLYLNVTSDFSAGQTLSISNLGVLFQASAVAAAAAQPLTVSVNTAVDTDTTSDVDLDLAGAPSVQPVEGVAVSVPATQVPNAFTTTGSIPQTALLRVALTAKGGDVALTALTFSQSLVGALSLANLELEDEATGTRRAATSGLTFSGIPDACGGTNAFCLSKDATKTFLLRGSASGLDAATPAEAATLSLAPGGITAAKGKTSLMNPLPAGALIGATVSKTHTMSTYLITAPQAGDTLVAGTPGTITWQAFGLASPSSVTVSYSTDGGASWTPLTCTISGSGSTRSCATTVPDAVTIPPQTAQIKVRDASQPIERLSPAFTIGGVTQLVDAGAFNLPGGAAWLIGNDHTITWKQLGSFTVRLELSQDGGATWPTVLGTQAVTALTLTEKTATFTYTVPPSDGGSAVQVRVLPDAASSAVGSRVSAAFAVRPAFSNIEPSGGQVLKDLPVTITWDRLDGTKPGDLFPVNTVTLTILDVDKNPLHSMTTGNDGSEEWIPTQLITNGKIRVCDANRPSVCNTGTQFDVIGPSITLSPAQADYTLGDAVTLQWGGGLTGPIKLLLMDQSGAEVLEIQQVNSTGSGQYIWTIPTGLPVPQANARVRLQSVDRPTVFVDSSPFAIHGHLKNLSIAPTPVKTENAAADASNDVTISWQSTGATPVKLWIKRQGDASYQPLSSFGAGAAADAVSGTSFAWTNILGTAKTPQAQLKVTQVGDEAAVFAESAVFAIIGELAATQPAAGASFDLNNPAQLPIRLEWTTLRGPVTQVRLRVLDSANAPQPLDGAGATELLAPNPASPSGYDWTPPTTYPNLRVEVCDADALGTCATSGTFSVTGLKMVSPAAGARFVIGQTGVAVPITWKPVGGSGAVNLSYRIGTGQPMTLANGLASIDNATNTYTWLLPTAFPNLSDQVVVTLQDASGSPTNDSAPFTIAGAVALTGVIPVKATYAVGETVSIAWQRFGGITDLRLQYCGVDCAVPANWRDGPALSNVSTPTGTFSNWAIPMDAISANLQLRAVDATAGHPAADSTSVTITVTPGLVLTLPDAAPWVAGEVHPVQWSTNGLVEQVQLLYAVNGGPFTPMAGTPLPNGMVPNTGNAVQWQGSFDWRTVDPNLSREPLSYSPATVAVKVMDASQGHVPIEQVSSALSLIYLKVVWQVKDLTTRNILGGLNVLETSFSTGTATWQVTDGSIIPNSPAPVGVLRYYPADQYTTTWSRTGSSEPAVVSGWQVARAGLQDFNGDAVVNPLQDGIVKTAFIELDANQQLPWGVPLRFQYQPGPPAGVLIMGWLEKRGLLQDAQLVQQLDVEIRDATQAVKTLSSAAPDPTGVFRLTWDLTDSAGNPADVNAAYYAKATITTVTGAAMTSGDMLAVGGPGGLTLAEFQAAIQPVQSDLGAVKTATVGPASTLEQVKAETGNIQTVVAALPAQLNAAQTAIQNDIATARTALGTQLDAVQADTTAIKQDTGAIKAETDKISAEVLPAISNVQAYLQDPDAGLPKIQQTLTQQGDQLKALRRGGILNLDTQLRPGQAATIQYRSEGGSPAMSVYDGTGAAVTAPPLALNAATGLYEATFPLAAEGVYRVVVTESASANSAGTIDSVALTVEASMSPDVATGIDALTSAVQALEMRFDTLQATASASQATADRMQTQTQQLLDQWGTLDGQAVMEALNGLDTETLMQQMAEVQEAVGAVQGSGTAATFSQGAWAAANEAVELLKAMKSGDGASQDTQTMLTQLNDKLAAVSKAVSSVSAEAIADQLKTVTEQMKTMASEKGYHFDALYDMNKTQATTVQTTRNRVEELKALVELQQALLQRNLDRPVVKTWFEGR